MSSKEAEKAETQEETPKAEVEGQPKMTSPAQPAEEPAKEDVVNGAPKAQENQDDGKSRRVYVGNLPWDVSWQDLKDLMKSTGHEVTRSDIMTTPDGRSKGCGIVEFATAEGAQQAVLTLNDTELKGRPIFVREDREDRGGISGRHQFSSGEQAQSRRVYVGNLSWDVAWPDLKDHMRQAGEVVHAEVISEYNGRSKGCGVVEYATEEEAQVAIETLTHTELKGRTIFVREDRETSSSGGAPSGGGRNQITSVYVWNLAYETTWQELKDHMRKAGNVNSAKILTDHEGKSNGSAVVEFQRAQDAARAIRELQDSELNFHAMHLRQDRTPQRHGHFGGGRGGGGRGRYSQNSHQAPPGGGGGGSSGRQVFVGNLSFTTTWRELKDYFAGYGNVERADVKFSGGRSRGFGTVLFASKAEAEAAIEQLNGTELDGRTLEVRLDQKF